MVQEQIRKLKPGNSVPKKKQSGIYAVRSNQRLVKPVIQRAISRDMVESLYDLGVNGVRQKGDTGTVWVKEGGDTGSKRDVITKDWFWAGNYRTAKEKALQAIAAKAGEIGDAVKNAKPKDFGKGDQFYVDINAKYKARGNWNWFFMDSRDPVTLTLKYDFRKVGVDENTVGGPGYIVGVSKTKKEKNAAGQLGFVSANMVNQTISQTSGTYSNMHETSKSSGSGYNDQTNILSETYKKSNSDAHKNTIVSRNWDAYTKLAGEGARFQCVRNHIGKISNDTVFYCKDQKGDEIGIKFMDLWKQWNSVFKMRYNISDKEIADELRGRRLKRKVSSGGDNWIALNE